MSRIRRSGGRPEGRRTIPAITPEGALMIEAIVWEL
jgi:hypothetical protein